MHCSFVLSLITETDNEAISLPFSFQPHPWMSIVRHDLCRDTSTLWCNHLASPWSHSSVLLAQGLRGSAAHQRYALCCFNYRAAKQPGWAVAITWYYFVMEREGRGGSFISKWFFFSNLFFSFSFVHTQSVNISTWIHHNSLACMCITSKTIGTPKTQSDS